MNRFTIAANLLITTIALRAGAAAYVVAGVDVGLPYKAKAPDIGAHGIDAAPAQVWKAKMGF